MRRCVLLFSFALAIAVPVAADYEQAYRAGLTAYDKKAWQDAVAAMQQAIRERPNESAKKTVQIYGMRFEPYIPHYYLGMALANAGRCSEAMQPLKETLRQKVISSKLAADVERMLARCASVQPQPPVVEPEEKKPQPPTPLPPTKAPETGNELERDKARLEMARQSLSTALGRARGVLRSVPRDVSPREAATLKDRVRKGESASASLSADEMVAATRELAVASGDLETWLNSRETPPAPQRSGPPRQLVLAVDAYLRGDYKASLRALDGAVFSEPRSRAQALLFRAASQHALFVIDHGRDKDLYTRALSDAREYKRLQKKANPDARVFSPDFIQFVQGEGNTEGARQIVAR